MFSHLSGIWELKSINNVFKKTLCLNEEKMGCLIKSKKYFKNFENLFIVFFFGETFDM